ncbi:unnamed protein product [Acanthoscelides obtectus]|uniref:Uncharacterized protein n=1 Tax=Acanthoscelides obtectus TaxID=200917 RepID=A0A9P0KCS6_ACAOB|nr:unnamed protein product [Acanthoscelides obtectus]CAK1683125.1 hypothetical protein AOBTE_LOCUS34094 [Acanthoscelides obtectus]
MIRVWRWMVLSFSSATVAGVINSFDFLVISVLSFWLGPFIIGDAGGSLL